MKGRPDASEASRYAGGMMMLTGTLLLVEDDPESLAALKKSLEDEGHTVLECTTGPEALDRVASGDEIDVILLDVNLPGMSGYDVCYSLRQSVGPQDLPVIFLSGRHKPVDVVMAFECGANDYVTKPCDQGELMARINIQLALALNHRTLEQRNEQLRQAQQHLVQQEKMAALGLLSAGIAHEINNPNNFLRISADNMTGRLAEFRRFLMDLVDENESEVRSEFIKRFNRLEDDLALVREGSQRIKDIVSGMRNASRSDSSDEQVFDPVEGLQATLVLVKPTYKTEIDFVLELTERCHVRGRPSQLNQVFTNLLVNACQAIDTASSVRGCVTVRSKIEGDELRIAVADSGCGMTEEVKARVFEPFFTTKGADRGTGLGLSICKNIIEEHGGRIEIESVPGKGACITVVLPVSRDVFIR